MAEHELNVVLLEERTSSGWAGLAEITCPHCKRKHTVHVFTVANGRSVSFYEAGPGYTSERTTIHPKER